MISAISCRPLGPKLKNVYMLGCYVTRNMASIQDYKIEWLRPTIIPITDPRQSGDLGLDITVKPDEFKLHYEKSKELQEADDVVKKLFSLKFQREKEARKVMREKAVALVQRHTCDASSPEYKIAEMTIAIQTRQKLLATEGKKLDGKFRHALKVRVEQRGKYLRQLRTWDYARYEWILEKLNLVHKNLPKNSCRISRRESLTRLTKTYCKNIIQNKFNTFEVELKEEKKKFYAEKIEKLLFIIKEEKECGLTPTVTEEDIEIARKKLELLNIPEEIHEIE